MKTIKDLLQEELKRSRDYQLEHFGAYTGDGFEDLVRELSRSKTFFSLLQLGLMNALEGVAQAKIPDSMKIENADDAEKFVIQNLNLFRDQLNMLYWGIQVGKRLAKEQDEIDKVTQKLVAEAGQVAEAKADVCGVCEKSFESGDIKAGPVHLCCADPKLSSHKKLWKPTADGSGDVIGYYDEMGLAHWADGTAQAVN